MAAAAAAAVYKYCHFDQAIVVFLRLDLAAAAAAD